MGGRVIFVGCPAFAVTGGPTLAHQFCYELIKMGVNAKMYYYTPKGEFTAVGLTPDSPYHKYGVSSACSMEEIDKDENVVVLPETAVGLHSNISHATICVWWMSVDNYMGSLIDDLDRFEEDYDFFHLENVYHFVQSAYANDFIMNRIHVDPDKVKYLTDYIDEDYQVPYDGSESREDIVYYNYSKMGNELPQIMEKNPEIRWVPIRDMTRAEVIEAFHKGKVYIDFGNHPGRDRLPREAAACGLCVITNRKGAAAYDEDIPISDLYRFEDPLVEEDRVVDCIRFMLDDYESSSFDFEYYRDWIKGDHDRFVKEVEDVVKLFEEC